MVQRRLSIKFAKTGGLPPGRAGKRWCAPRKRDRYSMPSFGRWKEPERVIRSKPRALTSECQLHRPTMQASRSSIGTGATSAMRSRKGAMHFGQRWRGLQKLRRSRFLRMPPTGSLYRLNPLLQIKLSAPMVWNAQIR